MTNSVESNDRRVDDHAGDDTAERSVEGYAGIIDPADLMRSSETFLRSGVGMSDHERIEHTEKRIADIERWMAAHDGRINALWENQHTWNNKHEASDDRRHDQIDQQLHDHSKKITDLRVMVAKYVGAGVVIGSLLGAIASTFIARVGGG